MSVFNPTRLILVRKRKGLTAKKLAEKIGVSPVTLTRLEKAKNEPLPETIEKIAEVTNYPLDFFYGENIDELEENTASFRSLSTMTAKERKSALSAGSMAYIFSDWVSEKFNLPKPDLLDLSQEIAPAAAAVSIRQHWGLGVKSIGNIISLLESKGIRVFSLAENTKNVDAFSCWRNDTPYIFLNTFKSSERSRFDAAHELGHLILHKHGAPRQSREVENEANAFAGAFLMPTTDVLSRLPNVKYLDQVVTAKKRWGVSVAALAYRLHRLKILSDWQYQTFSIQINKRRYRTEEPNSMPHESSVVWEKVFRALWSDGITRDHIAKDLCIPVDEIDSLVFNLSTRGSPSDVLYSSLKIIK